MNTSTCVSKLFFALIDGKQCRKHVFRVALTNDGHQKCERDLTEAQQSAVDSAFTFFNTPKFENAYAIDFDGGLTDGIMRAAIHHDIAEGGRM